MCLCVHLCMCICNYFQNFRERTILPLLKQHFKRDEFIGRINEILFFLPFTTEQLRGLARKELLKWKKTAHDRSVGILAWLPVCVCVSLALPVFASLVKNILTNAMVFLEACMHYMSIVTTHPWARPMGLHHSRHDHHIIITSSCGDGWCGSFFTLLSKGFPLSNLHGACEPVRSSSFTVPPCLGRSGASLCIVHPKHLFRFLSLPPPFFAFFPFLFDHP